MDVPEDSTEVERSDRSRSLTAIRVVGVNLAVAFALVGLLTAGPLVLIHLAQAAQTALSGSFSDDRSQLENYDGVPWATQHFSDLKQLRSTYTDFLVWRPLPLRTETVTVDDEGDRVTPAIESREHPISLYGGSVVFGFGSRDDQTLSAHLQRQTGRPVANRGRPGYLAHQNALRILDDQRLGRDSRPPQTVVFLDGVNDVYVGCRAENEDLATTRQESIRQRVRVDDPRLGRGAADLIRPAADLLRLLTHRDLAGPAGSDPESSYVCDTDPVRARRVASALVETWRSAATIVAGGGNDFIAALQPVSYLSRTPVDHLADWRFDNEFAAQYRAVYPLIRELAADSDFRFVDLSGSLDGDEYVYIDFCHVSPRGNALMAEALARAITVPEA